MVNRWLQLTQLRYVYAPALFYLVVDSRILTVGLPDIRKEL